MAQGNLEPYGRRDGLIFTVPVRVPICPGSLLRVIGPSLFFLSLSLRLLLTPFLQRDFDSEI